MTDKEPWLYNDGCREDEPRHLGDSEEHASVTYSPREPKPWLETETGLRYTELEKISWDELGRCWLGLVYRPQEGTD